MLAECWKKGYFKDVFYTISIEAEFRKVVCCREGVEKVLEKYVYKKLLSEDGDKEHLTGMGAIGFCQRFC